MMMKTRSFSERVLIGLLLLDLRASFSLFFGLLLIESFFFSQKCFNNSEETDMTLEEAAEETEDQTLWGRVVGELLISLAEHSTETLSGLFSSFVVDSLICELSCG